jgi:hypothetical protein
VDVVGDCGDDSDREFGDPGGRREVSVRGGMGWSGDESCGRADRVELDALRGWRRPESLVTALSLLHSYHSEHTSRLVVIGLEIYA